MTAPPDSKHLQLSVTNLGPIARADIDLRPMTVFVGPSNKGKSYLATLVYALHRAFGGDSAPRGSRFGGNLFGISSWIYGNTLPSELEELDIPEGMVEELGRWYDSEVWATRDLEKISESVPPSIASLLLKLLENSNTIGETVSDEVKRCFGIENVRKLVRRGSRGGLNVVARSHVPRQGARGDSFEYTMTLGIPAPRFQSSIPTDARLSFFYMDEESILPRGTAILEATGDERIRQVRETMGHLINNFVPHTVHPLNRVAHYLPADRTGIMHAHQVVVGSLIRQVSDPYLLRKSSLPGFSGVIADFLGTLVDLGGHKYRSEEELSGRIETEMLDGAISVEGSFTSYPGFFYQPAGSKDNMRLMNTSSMVSELAPVVLYLRHVVRPGETLIIEEPESSLHPAMQVEFVRHLAAAVRAGVRIMITTHSEWILDELTNLALLNELPESRRKGIGGADFALDPSDVGVWLFKPQEGRKGTVVKEIPFDVEFGGFRSGFDDVAVGTYNDYARISNRIEEAKAEYDPR